MTTRSTLPEIVPKSKFSVRNLGDPSKWNQAFQNSSEYKSLGVLNLGKIPLANIQTGDIIIWPNDHIGICLVPGVIYQSNGYSNHDCLKNLDVKHGPRTIPITPGWINGFGSPQGDFIVLRIINTTFVFPPGC